MMPARRRAVEILNYARAFRLARFSNVLELLQAILEELHQLPPIGLELSDL
jgi:hypothetical protein